MKRIKLTQNKYTLVDDEDHEWLNAFKWYFGARGKAVRTDKNRKMLYMSRVILEHYNSDLTSLEVDHIDLNTLDNRKINLRVATHHQNLGNLPKFKRNTSGFKGVAWHSIAKRWRAYISKNGRYTHLGLFNTKEEAAVTYDKEAARLRGEFARLNIYA